MSSSFSCLKPDFASSDTDRHLLLSQTKQWLRSHGGGDDVDSQDPSTGKTALHYACSNNHEALVDLLLEYHANVYSVCFDGRTPLHDAAHVDNPSIIRKLMRHHADVCLLDNFECAPLHYACITQNSIQCIKLVSHPLIINFSSTEGKTPLGYVSDSHNRLPSSHSHSIIQFLRSRGAVITQ